LAWVPESRTIVTHSNAKEMMRPALVM